MSRTDITNLPAARARYVPTELTTFIQMNPGQTAQYSVGPLPRTFRPNANTQVYFPLGLYTGLVINPVSVTGSTLVGWTANYSLTNNSSNVITPTPQQVVVYQTA